MELLILCHCEEAAGRRRLIKQLTAAWSSGAGRSVRRSNLKAVILSEAKNLDPSASPQDDTSQRLLRRRKRSSQ